MRRPICAACGGEVCPHYESASDYITGDRFQVLRCVTCGCGQTSPAPADLGRFYPAGYRQFSKPVVWVLQILYRVRVKRWAARFAAPGSVFEVGCGNGLMLATLRDLGWRVAGSERTEAAARIPRERFGLPVIVGGPETMVPSARYDLLLMFQVLEHLQDPAEAVAALASHLKPGGKLIIGVPNFASWQARFGRNTWFHLDVPRHLHHFTRQGLVALAARHGLDVESVSFVSPEHDPYGWLQSILSKLDTRPNRLARLLMRLDRPDPLNLLHLVAGCFLGVLAVPLSLASWVAGRGALIEVTCVRRAQD